MLSFILVLLHNLTLPIKELEALAAAASDDEFELEEPSGSSPPKSKSSPLRPSPSKKRLSLPSPRVTFDVPAELVQEEEDHEADDEKEEDDGDDDFDALMKNLDEPEPEEEVEHPELDMSTAADRPLEDEGYWDEEMEEDDVLSVLFADEHAKMEEVSSGSRREKKRRKLC